VSNKKKPIGMAFDITTGKSYKVYQPESETITLTLTREQAEALLKGLNTGYLEDGLKMAEMKKQIEEKLK